MVTVVVPGGAVPVSGIRDPDGDSWPADILSLLKSRRLAVSVGVGNRRGGAWARYRARNERLRGRGTVRGGGTHGYTGHDRRGRPAEEPTLPDPRQGLRYLFGFVPQLVTPDEVGEIGDLTVATVLNGEVRRENVVSNMMFSPWFLIFPLEGVDDLTYQLCELTTPQRSASPPRWVSSQGSRCPSKPVRYLYAASGRRGWRAARSR